MAVDRANLTLTESMVHEMAETVAKGNFRHVAAALVGVPANTLHSWTKRGREELADFHAGKRKDRTVKAVLVVELDKAEAVVHGKLVADVVTDGDAALKLKFLQLRYNKLWNKNPNAVDDATGEETRQSGADILAEKLAGFIEDE